MTELRIYELLNEMGGNGGAFGADDRHKLTPEAVGNVCKTVSDMLYDTLKDKGTAAMGKRADLIQLIRKWCVRDGGHFYPDDGNYTCFLKCLSIEEHDELSDFLDEEFRNCDLFDDDRFTTYIQFYKEQDERSSERRRRLDAVLDGDGRTLGEIEFAVVKKDILPEGMEKFLARLFGVADGEVLKIKAEETRRKTLAGGRRASSRISLAYASLNLPKNDLTASLMTSIIKGISTGFYKDQCEVDLLEHVLAMADDADFRLKLLKKFPFLYERPLILLCVDELSGGAPPRKIVKCLFKLSRENHWLKTRISLLVYELFALSDYNARVLNVIKLLE